MSQRNSRRSTARTAAVAGAVLGALLLAGCTSPVPTPTVDDSSASAEPALTVEQMAEVREAVGATLDAANATHDASQLATRLSGPALSLRTSQLGVAATRGNGDLVTVLPTAVQQDIITTTDSWPRQAYAVTEQPEDLQSPRLLGYEQTTARDPYKLWAWVRLFPSVKLPSFAGAAVGSESVPLDDPSLLMTPTDAVAQYADVLNLGAGSGFAASFADDPLRAWVATNAQTQAAPLATAAGTQTMTFTPTAGEARAVRTADGGAMVMAAMTALETRTAEEGAKITPGTETEKALFGATPPTNVLNVGYTTMVAMYIPPADATTGVQVLGMENIVTSVATS
ncbi:hypothetical protein [Oerskovia enterophila]|uniref:DUF8094 domain-containing protein n=1 Tax=Oerskovia enterophila TaxID=43678 RepID=A0A163S7Y7_9CELL|nr:hypothetical protein [Oerskovia enterophila]KZM36102.1 hypothetical protein OJAG_11970 [Oerskovia enterophila]OCI29966.1 hypothetical protein OERS_33500 [Oerskovia enterophila]